MENNHLSSRENSSARGAKEDEQPYYIFTKDGYGNEVKHLNFKNKEVCKREGIIELIPLRTSSRHQNNVSFRSIWDRKNQAIIGIPMHIDMQTKQWVYQKISLVDSETLDLSIEQDAMKWAVIKHSHFLKGSPNLKDKPIYEVRDKQRMAEITLQKRAIKRKAETIAEGLFGEQLIDMARNIGIAPEQNSVATLQVAVIEFAEKNPDKFMDMWDSPLRVEMTVLKKALALGVVEHDTHGGIMYRSISLGLNEPQAAQYLKENPNQLNAIESLNQLQEDATVKAMAKEGKQDLIEDEKDAELKKALEEIEKLKEANKKLAKQKLEETLNEDVKKSVKDPEHLALLEKAKQYKIKGYALMKKPALEKAVNEAEGIANN